MPILLGRRTPQAGFSLVEMLIAITVAGLLLAISTPRIRDTLIQRDVRSARAAIANLYARARVQALQTRKPATINFNGTTVWVTVPLGASLDTVGAPLDLTNAYGVTVTASSPTVVIQPTGLALGVGAPVVIKVTRSGKADSVTISGYGRLQ